MSAIRWVTWNLFLAAIPVVLGYVLWWCMGGRGSKRKVHPLLTLPLWIAWLLFLPNTCYLLTEWRHLFQWIDGANLPVDGTAINRTLLQTSPWLLFFLLYSGAGILLFTLSVRPIEQRARLKRIHPVLYFPVLFFLTSLGVYLGLVLRFNSWDVVHIPHLIWARIAEAMTTPELRRYILGFACFLWVVYEMTDIWVDGLADRLKRITG